VLRLQTGLSARLVEQRIIEVFLEIAQERGWETWGGEPYNSPIAGGMGKLVTALSLKEKAVPINLGDLFTAFARKGC